jgi:hypothetical protein
MSQLRAKWSDANLSGDRRAGSPGRYTRGTGQSLNWGGAEEHDGIRFIVTNDAVKVKLESSLDACDK